VVTPGGKVESVRLFEGANSRAALCHFRCGETGPIARLVRVAVAPRCAVQEVDPRFSRLAALTLVNWMAANHPGMEAGAPEAKPQTLQFRRRLKEEERGSKFPDSG
jgi:hypothetical protein